MLYNIIKSVKNFTKGKKYGLERKNSYYSSYKAMLYAMYPSKNKLLEDPELFKVGKTEYKVT